MKRRLKGLRPTERAGQGHRAEDHGVVAQRGEQHLAAVAGAGQTVVADDVLHDRHHEVAAGLDHAAAQDDDLRVDQVADGEAGVAQHFRGVTHDLGHQGVFGLQGAGGWRRCG